MIHKALHTKIEQQEPHLKEWTRVLRKGYQFLFH
jgi:hypothetical protein